MLAAELATFGLGGPVVDYDWDDLLVLQVQVDVLKRGFLSKLTAGAIRSARHVHM